VKKKRQELKKVLGRTEIFALSFGTMVGWGWLVFTSNWIGSAGVLGAIVSFLFTGLMCVFVGLTYAELTSAFPLAGGEVAFSYRAMGYFGSWFTGWTLAFAYIGVAAWEGIALSTAFHYLIPLPKLGYLWTIAGYDVYLSWSIVGIVGAVILTALNLIGVKPAAIIQIMLVMVMIIVGVIFVLGGVAFGDTENLKPVFTDFKGIGIVMLMAPSMFIGFDVVSKSAEEMNMPIKYIARVLILSIVLAMVWYILMILATALSAPQSFLNNASVPAANSAALAFHTELFAKIIIVGGICGILTSWNGFIVGASRIIFAMGRAKMLPFVFGRVNARSQAPSAAIGFVGFLCCLSPLMGENALVWLVDASAFGTVIAYLMVSVSFLLLRKREPDLRRPYSVRKGTAIGCIAVASELFFLYWYTPLSSGGLIWPYEWGLVVSWVLVGLLLVALHYGLNYKDKVRESDRELLIFGEEYARERP
jgi:amino acid transporter